MNEYKFHYLYATLDIDAFSFDTLKYNFINITAFRLVDISDVETRQTIKAMRNFRQKIRDNDEISSRNNVYLVCLN